MRKSSSLYTVFRRKALIDRASVLHGQYSKSQMSFPRLRFLRLAGATPVGQRELQWIDLDHGRPQFPEGFPDTQAAKNCSLELLERDEAHRTKRPRGMYPDFPKVDWQIVGQGLQLHVSPSQQHNVTRLRSIMMSWHATVDISLFESCSCVSVRRLLAKACGHIAPPTSKHEQPKSYLVHDLLQRTLLWMKITR